ncbi:hypothetical protein [Streptomyces sp. NPDC059063]|uniref:hypothetical protein n=1 Tax=unclassified Streptomyces TaxID=2593676 RepID=UPI0036AE912F
MTGTVRVLRRLIAHELRGFRSLGRWVARRPPHGVHPGDSPAAYTGPQTATLFAFAFLAVVETVALALVIPWPLAHAALLLVDAYTVAQIVALHAACVTRPHVVGPDGALRVRYGQFLDLRIAAEDIRHARVDRRYPDVGRTLRIQDDSTVDVVVGSQTTVTVELVRPVEFVRPLGRRAHARVVRFHADEPRELVAALSLARAARSARAAQSVPSARSEAAVTPERTAPSDPNPSPDPAPSPAPDPLASA